MIEPADDSLRRFRREHVGRLIAELHRDFSARIRERLVAAGHDGVTAAHLKLFRSLPVAGARLTALAERMGITAQSAGARVDELVALGYLERVPDASDRRATRICFSRRGKRLLTKAQTLIAEIEREYAMQLGATRFATLKASLASLVAALGIEISA